jgi:hypothetical protein
MKGASRFDPLQAVAIAQAIGAHGVEYLVIRPKWRKVRELYPIANLSHIISSKRASERPNNVNELSLFEKFRKENERLEPKRLKGAWEIERLKEL